MTLRRPLLTLVLLLSLLPLCWGPALAAWPLTPRTTYVAGTTPAIKAADLNAFQTAINGTYGGTSSVVGLTADGFGGMAVTPSAGAVIVTRTTSGTTLPTASSGLGELTVGFVPQCWGLINSAGLLVRGVNLRSVANPSTGVYTIVCNASPGHPASAAVSATLLNTASPRMLTASSQDEGGGRLQVNVRVYDISTGGAVASSENFQFVAYGE